MTAERVHELFDQIDGTMFGPQERALVDEAVALAVETGDEELEYHARMRLTASAKHSGDTDTLLSSFAWCLAKYDSDPARFPADIENGAADLLWQYKWMAGTLGSSPIFGTDEIAAVLTDMEEHYRRAGLGMSGVHTARFEDAWRNGRIDEAERLRLVVEATPRDDHSHCDACGRSDMSGFLAETGREDQALVLVGELVEGGFSCGDEPEYALSRALLPYLRAGRFEEAKSAHLRSYRLSRDNADKISIVANHLVFCAITGNEARGLAMLERHIGWLAHDGLNVSGHFSILVACGVLLDAVTRAGHGDSPVRGSDAPELRALFGIHDGPWSVSDLSRAVWSAAGTIGAAFDERNGNDYYASLIARGHALESERYDVPITTDAFVPAPVTLEDPVDAAGWHTRAREMANLGDVERGIAAARRAIEGTTGRDRDGAWSLLVGGLVRTEQWDEAEAALVQRGLSLRESGRPEQADLEQRLGLALFGRTEEADREGLERELAGGAGLPQDVLADIQLTLASVLMSGDDEPDIARVSQLLRDAVTNFDTPDTQFSLASALSFQAQFEAMAGDGDVARTAADRLIALEPDRGSLASALMLRARLRGGAGDYAAGAEDADRATRLFLELDAPRGAVDAASIAASLLDDAGDAAEALARLRFAVRQSDALEGVFTGLRFAFGRLLVRSGEAAEGTEVLAKVYDDETEQEVPDASRAETLYWLGHAFSGDEQHGNALGAWNQSIELFVSGEDLQGAAKAGVAAGRLLGNFGEHEDALEFLEPAAERARQSPDNLELLTTTLHAFGSAQANAGDASGLSVLDEVIAIAEQHDATWLAADVTDSKARALRALDRVDEAIALGLTGADRYLAAGDATGAASAELMVARMLVESERGDDAVPIFRSAIEHAEGHPQIVPLAAMELGDVLERLGRTDEAAAARSLAE